MPIPPPEDDNPAVVVEPARTLLGLLSAETRQFGRTVMLTGPWGCGKTYLWKREIAPRLGRQHIYISAFGAEGAASLKGRLLVHLAKNLIGRVPLKGGAREKVANAGDRLRAFFGRTADAISTSLNSIGGALLRRADLDALELVDLLDESTVICIDDLERVSSSFNFEDLMGIANIISEHKHLDVVLICNEDEILHGGNADRAKQYLRHREKTISLVRHISADPIAMFDRIADGAVRSASALERVRAAKPNIGEVFKQSKTENLRLLARVCGYLEAMVAAGLRELTETEIRFLAAITIYFADESAKDDGFLEFNPVVLRITSSVRRSKDVDLLAVARMEFIEKFFGENEYGYHPGIVQLVRKGTIDPGKFVVVASEEPSAVQQSLAQALRGEWRYWTDDQLRRLIGELVGHLESNGLKSAHDVLYCLAYLRVWAEIFEEAPSESGERAAKKALQSLAEAGDASLGHEREFQMSGLSRFIKDEVDEFAQAAEKFERDRLVRETASLFIRGDLREVGRLLGGSDLNRVKAAFEVLDAVMPLATTSPRNFELIVGLLLEQSQAFSGLWPEAGEHRGGLIRRLESIRDAPGTEHLTRWRLAQILGRVGM